MTAPILRARSLRELMDNNELPAEEEAQYQQLIGAMNQLIAGWTWTDIEQRIFGRSDEPPGTVYRPM